MTQISPETTITGRIQAVYAQPSGSDLLGDATAGDGVLVLADVFDFDENGGTTGTVTSGDGLTSEAISWSGVDDTTGTLTLVGTLANSYSSSDGAFATPDASAVEVLAQIIRDDVDDELIEARVLHRWLDAITEGVRDPGTEEAVTLAFDGTDWVVTDILGQTPIIDGSTIDPTTLPPPAASDGSPPASSPTAVVRGGIGSLFVSWLPISNADPPTYEVHVSTTTGFTPSGSSPGSGTFAVETDASQAVVRTLPDGSALDYATTYFVRLIARDVDGAAAVGVQGSGSPVQVTGDDIAVETVTADNILANTITADELSAILLLAGTIETAGEGQRVVIDPSGIHLYDSSGNELVAIPTDDSKSPTFRGDVVTGGLTVLDRMLIQGPSNAMDKGATLTLNAQLNSPGSAPSLAFEYDTDAFPAVGITQFVGLDYTTAGGAAGSTSCYYTIGRNDNGQWYLFEVDSAGSAVLRSTSLGSSANTVYLGCAQLGAYVFVAYMNTATGNVNVQARNLSDLSGAGTTTVTPDLTTFYQISLTEPNLGFGTDGTQLLFVGWDSNSTGASKSIDRFSVSGAAVSYLDTKTVSGGLTRDASGNRILRGVTGRDGSNYCTLTQIPATSADISTFELYTQAAGNALLSSDGNTWSPDCVKSAGNSVQDCRGGVTYGASGYHGLRRLAPTIVHFSGWVWAAGSQSDTWYVGFQWYQTSGTLHTKLSPQAGVELNGSNPQIGRGTSSQYAMRGQLRVISPSLPADASDSQVYMLLNATEPTNTSLKLQSPALHSSGVGTYTQYLTSYASGGAAYVDTNTFPGTGTAEILAAGGGATAGWRLGGDSAFVIPRLTVAQRLASPVIGQLQTNEDTHVLERFDGSSYNVVGGPADELALLRRRLYAAAATAEIIKSRNMDPATAKDSISHSANGATRFYAVYWPGGTCTGMYYLIVSGAGAYTDSNARSGTAIYSSDGTTLSRVATLVGVLSEGAGLRKRVWTASASLAAGIYYVATKFVFSAGTPSITLGGLVPTDSSVLGGDANNAATPAGWALSYTQANDATQALPTSQLVSGLSVNTQAAFVGLY